MAEQSCDEELICLKRFCNLLLKERGIDISQYKRKFLLRRIAIRRRALGNLSLDEYIEAAASSEEEINKFLDVLTVNVSDFFRNPSLYESLKNDIFPRICGQKETGEIIKIWSAGCATGQEPYSLAAILDSYLEKSNPAVNYRVYATDVDAGTVEKAERGSYTEQKVMSVPPHYVYRYFERSSPSGKEYTVRDSLRKNIAFIVDDMLNPFSEDGFDMIVCRNVMIYFSIPLQKKVIDIFHRKLLPSGYLVLGQVERLLEANRADFKTADPDNHIYQKTNGEDR